jgi:hypothetical protein
MRTGVEISNIQFVKVILEVKLRLSRQPARKVIVG